MTEPIKIPIHRPYLGQEELNSISNVFNARWLGMGSVTKEFEAKLQDFIGAKHVVAVNTGTSALHLALDALGMGPGDEIIVPSLTFVATPQSILAVGACPAFCDVCEDTLNMDIDDVAHRINRHTRAIMPVHYGGEACEMDKLLDLARKHHLYIVEDAAHAFGSAYKGRQIGTIGDITCFSFDPVKNITCGDGGAITTDSDEIYCRINRRRSLGIDVDSWDQNREERHWFYQVVD